MGRITALKLRKKDIQYKHMRELRHPFFVAILVLTALFFLSGVWGTHSRSLGMLEVTFLDVGQGDAIFIESPSGTQVLVDGGKGNAVLRGLQKRLGYFDRDIDMIVATHPDLDHIGGLIDVLKRYKVKTILMTENIGKSPAFKVFLAHIKNEGVEVVYARKGQVFDFGLGPRGSTTLSILFPDHDPTNLESNMSSIVAQLVYGETEYLLTGDSPSEIEEYLVGVYGTRLQSDVLKAGHHGSHTSSSEALVSSVQPQYVIFSTGKDNSYGHPHAEVTERFTTHGVIQKNTADSGSISSVSDGIEISF